MTHITRPACLLIVAAIVGAPSGAIAQTCPTQVKKDVVSEGVQSALPDGWFAWIPAAGMHGEGSHFGVYSSPLRTFTPRPVPNTSGDDIFDISIAADGQWILYGTASRELYLIRRDGSGKTKVPIASAMADIVCGFVRNGPMGEEIYYRAQSSLKAVKVTLAGAAPVFGAERTLASFAFPATLGPGEGGGVAGSHVFGNYDNKARMLTIPNNGQGAATPQNFDQFTGTMNYGCAETISFDGSMVAQNPGENDDGSGCIPIAGPGWSLNLNHKGFIVLPFLERASATGTWLDLYSKKSLSVNWCPKRFRYGSYEESGFVRWYFANNGDYIIGARNATKSPEVYGAWLVHWKSNTWTLLTDAATKVEEPAVHITTTSGVREASAGDRLRGGISEGGFRRAAVAGLDGRRMGTAACASELTRVTIVRDGQGRVMRSIGTR